MKTRELMITTAMLAMLATDGQRLPGQSHRGGVHKMRTPPTPGAFGKSGRDSKLRHSLAVSRGFTV